MKSGETLYLRGSAEKEAAARREKIDADLASGKGWQLKVTSRTERDDGKVAMLTKLVSSSRSSLFSAKLAAATSEAVGEIAPAKEEAKPAAKRKNAFAKAS